jgi:hypothetical protein
LRRIDSTNSTWYFDEERHRFCRLPRRDGDRAEPGAPPPDAEWQVFYALAVQDDGGFTVALNEDGTRLLRAWREEPDGTRELRLPPAEG